MKSGTKPFKIIRVYDEAIQCQTPTEAEAFHHRQDGLEATVIGMEGTVAVDVEHQIAGELPEALADDVAAPIVGLQGIEGEGHLLFTVAFDGNPAVLGEEDGRPAGLSEPELEEKRGDVTVGTSGLSEDSARVSQGCSILSKSGQKMTVFWVIFDESCGKVG